MLSPQAEKWGGDAPRPPPIDARGRQHLGPTTKWLEHLASVPAKKYLAPNCNLYEESYMYPFQLSNLEM